MSRAISVDKPPRPVTLLPFSVEADTSITQQTDEVLLKTVKTLTSA